MAKHIENTSSYELRMNPNQEAILRLDSTKNFYTLATKVCKDLVLTLHGAANPSWADFPIFNSYSSLSKVEKKKQELKDKFEVEEGEQEEEKIISEPYNLGVHLFVHWFVLESQKNAPAKHTIEPPEVRTRYKAYCRQLGVLPDTFIVENLLKQFPREEAVWVDRKAAYKHLRSQTNGKQLDKFIDTLVGYKSYPVQEGDGKTNNATRNILSIIWGSDDDKTDWRIMAKVVDFFFDCDKNLSPYQIAHTVLQRLELDPKVVIEELNRTGKSLSIKRKFNGGDSAKKGQNDALYIFITKSILRESEDDAFEKLLKDLAEKKKEYLSKGELAQFANSDAANFVMDCICSKIGVSYKFGNRCLTDEFTSILVHAMSKIRSFKKITLNQHDVRCKLSREYQDFDKTYLEVPEQFRDFITEYKREALVRINAKERLSEKFYLNERMSSGLDVVLAKWKKVEDGKYVEAIDWLSENANLKGDANFYKALVPMWLLYGQKKMSEYVKAATVLDVTDFKLSRLKTPLFQHEDRTAFYPEFGFASMPRLKLVKITTKLDSPVKAADINGFGRKKWRGKEQEMQEASFDIVLNLFDGQKFVDTKIPCNGKRALLELLQQYEEIDSKTLKGNKSGFRNHPLMATALNTEYVETRMANFSIKPFERFQGSRTVFYGKLTTEIACHRDAKVPSVKVLTSREKIKFMGIDLGWRNPISYAIIEKSSNGGDYKVEGCKNVYVSNPLETGLITSPTNRVDNVFSSESRFAYDYELDLLDELLIANEKDRDERDALMASQVHGDVAYNLLQLTKRVETLEDVRICEAFLHRVTYLFFGPLFKWFDSRDEKFASLRSDESQLKQNQGGLSSKRLDNITLLRRASSSLLKRCETMIEKKVDACVHGLRGLQKAIFEKQNNIRTERVRLLVNRTIRSAQRTDSRVIVAENLDDLTTSSGRRRSHNVSISDWCKSRIIKELEYQAKLVGIFVKKVSAAGTSIKDFTEEAANVKYVNVCRRFNKIEDVRHLGSLNESLGKKGILGNTLRSFCDRHGLSHSASEIVSHVRKYGWDDKGPFIPHMFGTTYLRDGLPAYDLYPQMDSDQNSACTIAVRGIAWMHERFHGQNKKKMILCPKSLPVKRL